MFKDIPFSLPTTTGNELPYIKNAIKINRLSGDHEYSSKCVNLLLDNIGCAAAYLTPSCTHALEMAALLTGVGPGDEVIMPSFAFTSTANAFVLRGAQIIFVDISPDTMILDLNKVKDAVTDRTRVIVPVHYAGVCCDMDVLMDIADDNKLFIVEDAAQAIYSFYKRKHLGSFGQFSTISFHETKNIQCGEGGAFLLNNKSFNLRAEIIREKGTNRSQYFRGEVDKYTWLDVGSSQLMSELNAAYLFAQLECTEIITINRLTIWDRYKNNLTFLQEKGLIELPYIPDYCLHNAHIFYLKVNDNNERNKLLELLFKNGINATFHYIPLHSSIAGNKYGKFHGSDEHTTIESTRIIRLPIYYNMETVDVDRVCGIVYKYFNMSF